MSSPRLKLILAISLLVNVFILGGLAGGAYRLWSGPDRAATVSAQPLRGVRLAAMELSAARQEEFRLALRDARRGAAPLVEQSRAGRREIGRLFAAQTFDAGATDRAMAETRQADIALRGRIENAVVHFAATLDPDERQRFAQGLQERGPLHTAPAPAQR
jgi:uncharacterized membrane protein